MSENSKFFVYKKHLHDSYMRLLAKANEYRFIDESVSDFAAYKAMKVLSKLNQLNYLQHDFTV